MVEDGLRRFFAKYPVPSAYYFFNGRNVFVEVLGMKPENCDVIYWITIDHLSTIISVQRLVISEMLHEFFITSTTRDN